MKVFHLINTLSAGGAELHLLTLCRCLKRQGVEVTVACLREKVKGSRSLRADFEHENIRVVNLKADSRYDVTFVGRLLLLLIREKPRILHSHLPRADIAAALICRLGNVPSFICSVHGVYRDRWFGRWIAPFLRRAYRKADVVIAISSAVKDWLNQDLRIDSGRVKVIHYGIEPTHFASQRPLAAEGALRRDRLLLGSIGRLEPGKGFGCLIRAMPHLHKQVPHACLWIAGHDPDGYGTKLLELIERLNLGDYVKLVGFQKDVSSFLHNVDIFAFASQSEGFGQVVIEAMAAGKPVVASKIPSLSEIVRHGETGFLVEPDDPQGFASRISWLLMHPEEAQQMGKNGEQRVYKHFSAQQMADKTLSLYKGLLISSSDGTVHVS